MRRWTRLTIGLTAIGIAASGCGSTGAGAAGGSGTARAAAATRPAGSTVRAAKVAKLGTVLVTGSGRTLYLFTRDARRGTRCLGSCAAAWPPLTVRGRPTAGPGVKASLLGTVRDPDGRTQVTYDHWPLYTYLADSGAGQANGQGVDAFGGRWYAVTEAGGRAGAASATGSGGGGGW